MSPNDSRATYRPSPSVYARPFGEELVLLDFDRGKYFGLNAVGALIWTEMGRGAAIADIVVKVATDYDVEADVAARDAAALVEILLAEGLIRATLLDEANR